MLGKFGYRGDRKCLLLWSATGAPDPSRSFFSDGILAALDYGLCALHQRSTQKGIAGQVRAHASYVSFIL